MNILRVRNDAVYNIRDYYLKCYISLGQNHFCVMPSNIKYILMSYLSKKLSCLTTCIRMKLDSIYHD